ncbi:MAG: hypothetical protein M0Z41_04895 [Peptococcaceae bacterium]|jgi:hypothetical protein|nr:hypothetical protein [Peptococcaceae bacterium]
MLNLEESAGYRRIYRTGERTWEINTRKKDILTFLESRFGDNSLGIRKQVELMDQPEMLENVLARLFAVNTLEDARRIVQDSANKSGVENKAVRA